MVAKGFKMHYFQDVVHKKIIKQMGAEFHNYGAPQLCMRHPGTRRGRGRSESRCGAACAGQLAHRRGCGGVMMGAGSDDLKIPDTFSKNRGLAKPLQLLPATAALLPYLLEATRAIGAPLPPPRPPPTPPARDPPGMFTWWLCKEVGLSIGGSACAGPTIIMYEASVTLGWAVARILGIPSVCVCSMNVGNTLNAMNPLIHEALMHDEVHPSPSVD